LQDIELWLQKEGIDSEVIRIFKDNRINAHNMKNLTDEGLQKMGVGHWNARSQVLEAIKKYDTASTLISPLVPNGIASRKYLLLMVVVGV
jgi:SAM domain (Sterile alpha motif)